MEPKVKAISLVEKYKNTITYFGYMQDHDEDAIECAKIAVDEIINICNNETGQGRMMAISQNDNKFWKQVQSELNNM